MKLIDQDTASILSQSSLLTGEAVFTSVLYFNQQFIFLDEHLDRLYLGATFLFQELNIEKGLVEEIKNALKLKTAGLQENRSIRITVTKAGFFIDVRPWEASKLEIQVRTSNNRKVKNLKPSYLKLSNYALEFYELKNLKSDDLIYLDTDQNLTEATTSNVFIVDQANQLITPPTSSTVLSGILRFKLLEFLKLSGFKVLEQELKMEEVYQARAIFFTNSIKGIRIVNKLDEKPFEKSLLLEKVITEFGRYGERIK